MEIKWTDGLSKRAANAILLERYESKDELRKSVMRFGPDRALRCIPNVGIGTADEILQWLDLDKSECGYWWDEDRRKAICEAINLLEREGYTVELTPNAEVSGRPHHETEEE